MKCKVFAVLLAAGIGSRMNSSSTKQMMRIGSYTVLERCVRAFDLCEYIDRIAIVCRAEELKTVGEQACRISDKVECVIIGGKTRAESAHIGFEAVKGSCDFVAIHDVARCLILPEQINAVVSAAIATGAASATSQVFDTLKIVDSDNTLVSTVDRRTVRAASTPQVFSCNLYEQGLAACSSVENVTDDNMLMEAIGQRVVAVDVGRNNIKITTPEDIQYAEFILDKRGELYV